MKEKLEKSRSPHSLRNLKALKVAATAMASVLIASACSGGEMKKQEEEFPRILPLSGELFLTQGAHANDDSLTGIKSSIDFAPKEVKKCPPGARVTVDQPAVATTSGIITIVGNERDRNDPNHSIVEIKEDGTGLRFGTMHLDDIDKNVQVGEKVKKGDVIGKPSCEVPKGGQTTGVHIHSYVKDANGSFAPITGQEISGWKIEGDRMTKKGEKDRIANTSRCATDTACGGIRNDLLNTPKTSSKAVLGAEKSPNSQISGNVNEKKVGETTPLRPTEKPTPTPIPQETIPVGWKPFRSVNFPYQTSIPSNWTAVSNATLGGKIDTIRMNEDRSFLPMIIAVSESMAKDITLEEYAENKIALNMQFFPNSKKQKIPISPKIIMFILTLNENGRSMSTSVAFFDAENKNNSTERNIVSFSFDNHNNNLNDFLKIVTLLRPRN